MKNHILYLTIFLVSISTFSQNQDYLLLEGKIDKFPIQMILTSSIDEQGSKFYTGYYSYNSQRIPISIYQEETHGNSLKMIYGGDENEQEIFDGILKNGHYKGKWTKGKTVFNFELKESLLENRIEIIHLTQNKEVPMDLPNGEKVQGIFSYNWFLPNDLKLQRELIRFTQPTYTDFKTFTDQSLENFESEYVYEINDFLKNFTDEELKTMSHASLNYVYMENFTPILDSERYLIMKQSGYQFTGGAHGMSYQKHFTYDKRNEKWINLNDVLNLKFKKEITKVLDKTIREKYHLPKNGGLSESENSIFLNDEIHISEDFTISKNGITFHYGLYEMTPYVYGYFDLFVPYSALKPYLGKGFAY